MMVIVMDIKVTETHITIVIARNPKPELSSSGKTRLLASERAKVENAVNGKDLTVQVNAYIPVA